MESRLRLKRIAESLDLNSLIADGEFRTHTLDIIVSAGPEGLKQLLSLATDIDDYHRNNRKKSSSDHICDEENFAGSEEDLNQDWGPAPGMLRKAIGTVTRFGASGLEFVIEMGINANTLWAASTAGWCVEHFVDLVLQGASSSQEIRESAKIEILLRGPLLQLQLQRLESHEVINLTKIAEAIRLKLDRL